jgi:branched-chain amino acid transport system substrate-binding protein
MSASSIRRFLMLLMIAVLAVTTGIPYASAQQASPYEIYVVIPMTGPAAFIGRELSDGLRIAETNINRTGGVRGRPVKFVVEDDQTSPAMALQLTNGIIAKKPSIFFGSTLTALCNAQIPLIKNGPTMYCYSPSVHPDTGSYLFSAMFASEDILGVSVRYLRERGLRKIAILSGTDATGIDADKVLADIIKLPENRDITYVAQEHFNLSELSVNAQLSRIKASGAQAIVAYVTGPAMATIMRSMTDMGLDLPIVSSPGNMSYTQLESYKTIVPKELLFAGPGLFAPDRIADPKIRQRVNDVLDQFRAAGIRPDNLHAIAWDVAQLAVSVLRKEGLNASPAQIRDGLMGVRDFYGGLGPYDFKASPQRGLTASGLVMVRWDPAKADFVGVSKTGGRL